MVGGGDIEETGAIPTCGDKNREEYLRFRDFP